MFWGEQVPSLCVSVPGTGGLGQWQLIQMACPGWGPGGAIRELGTFVRPWGSAAGAVPAPGVPRGLRGTPLALPTAPRLPPPPPESVAGRSLIRLEPALLSRRPSARGLVSPRRLCEEQDEARVISTPIPPTSCLPSWATKGPREAGPLRLPAPLRPC